MRLARLSLFFHFIVAFLAISSYQTLAAQSSPSKIGSLDLSIGGFQATVTPPQPTIPKNVASGVEIVVTQNGTKLTPAQVAQYLGGPFQLTGQYSGPGLTQTVDVPQTPADPNSLIINLPAVSTAGNYTLSNVQFVVNGAPVFDVSPSSITVQVIDQVLVTSVQTTPLTLDQIEAAGVVLDSSAYTGFQFTIGLQFSSQVVNVTFPVVFDPQGVAIPQPLSPPQISPPTGVNVPIPTIVPVLLQGTDGNGNTVSLPDLGGGQGTVKIPSVIVIPGNVGYLKQFFSAQLYVSNGAPGGSNLSVNNITGKINLPPGDDNAPGTADDPLALPNLVTGPQSATMNVLAPPPGGGTPSIDTLEPGDTGQAQWTIRGDKEGYHTIDFDIHGTLNGLPTGPINLTGSATGGVLVRNPYFDMTFTVPGVVRKGELFNVYATVSNISQVAANNLTVNFDQAALSGVTLVSPPSPVVPTLNGGDSTTLTFQFRSLQTGRVVASYLHFDTNDGTTGNLHFTLGVFANGTPMSPDTLVLPSSVDNLPTNVVDAAMRVLGQAWSVATAPTLPSGVIRTTQNLVNQKALLLAEAGLRQSLGEPSANALRDLGLDFFGGSPVDPGFDQVLRTTPAGEDFVTVLGSALAPSATQAGGAQTYEEQLANIEASGPSFVTFSVANGSQAAPVSVTLTDGGGNTISSSTPGGSIVGGAIFPLGSSGSTPYLGLITSPGNSPYTLSLTGQSSGSADISISIPRGDGSVLRGTVSGVQITAGEKLQIVADFNNPSSLVLQIDPNGSGTFTSSVPLTTQIISPSGPSLISATVIGAETVSQANNFGTNAVLLFDRPVDATSASTVNQYSIPNNTVTSASKQLSGRLVFANLAQPEGPYVPTTFAVSGIQDLHNAVGPSSQVNLQSRLQDPGAVVTGRVFAADGTPSSTAVVTYSNAQYDPTCQNSLPVGVASVPVQSGGNYQFRYVHQDNCGSPFQMATKDPNTGALRQVSTYVRAPGQQMVIDLALLGQGSVNGTVTDLSGNPVYNAQVVAISTADTQVGGSTFTDVSGHYNINGITVGPFTVKAVKGTGLGSAAGNIQRAGTSTTVNVTLNTGAVNVTGTVTAIQAGVSTPVPGAPVAYYLTIPGSSNPVAVGVATTTTNGSYSIQSVPAGQYLVKAILGGGFEASQTGVSVTGDNLVIPLQFVVPVTGTVTGKVSFPNNTPAGGVVIYQGQTGVLSNTDGTYTLPGIPILPSQSQTIFARTQDFTRSGQASVVVNSATTPATANITLSGLGTAQFIVLDATGAPVPAQKVTILDGSPNCGGTSQTTNASGIAIFTGLPVGSVRAAALARGNTDLATATATITQDGTTGFATMQFNGSGTVTGKVIDPTNVPVLGAVVQLSSNTVDMNYCILSQSITQSAQTTADGTFHFSGVNVGKVGVTASQAFFPTSVGAQGVISANGGTVNFPLQLVNTISGVLSGTVYLPDGVTPAGSGVQVIADGPLPNVTVSTDASGNFRFAKIFPEGAYRLTANDPVSGGTTRMQIYLRASQDMTQNLRLKGTGTINVRVVDGAGAPVDTAFVTLTETDYPNATFSGSLDASNQGVLPFPNVFEGDFSVKVTDPFGRGGRSSGTLPQGTDSVDTQVQLTTTGTVQGHFVMPDGTTPIPNASVQLTANGQSIGQATTLSNGDVGSYAFQFVPAGPIQLKGQDPLTGRTGIAAGSITTQGQTLTLDVKAQGLDTIQGLVTSNGAPEPGANVTLVSGNFQATTTADATGMYLMTGVPEGVIVATASLGNGSLSGTASSTITGDGKTLSLDVALRSSGTVTGQVVLADGVTPAPASTVTINVGGAGGGTETTTTDAQGNFSLFNVPSGAGTVFAQVLGGIDKASAQINIAAGGTTNVQVKLNGTGAVSGIALDSAGNPTAGTITLTGTGTFPYFLTLTAASDGTFSVPQVLAGPFTAKLSANIGGFTLFGTTTGNIIFNQTNNVSIQVQPSGTIIGTVLRPDGLTPAVAAAVKIQLTSGTITLQVQNDGTFTANGVPLGTFNIQINDPSTMGIAAIQGQTISSNGQTVNLGTITLDGNALSVTATNPVEGATGIATNQALTVNFSESLASTNGVFVSSGNTTIPLSSSLSADGKTVTLQGQLPDGVQLTLNATGQVTDIFGRQLLQPQAIHFTITDITPPFVTAVSPANLAIQVPVNSSVSVTFNKALSTTASFNSVITVSTSVGPIAGTTALTAPNVLTFTPSAPLATNTVYTVTVNGAVSFGGNIQTSAFNSSFVSPETVPPVLQMVAPVNGTFINNATPTISISMNDALTGINPATATLTVDGQIVHPSVGFNFMTFTPSAALADGAHTVAGSVQNNAGITGTLQSSFTVDTAPPSVAVLSGITAGAVLKGQITISASATDAVAGIAKINLLVDGVARVSLFGPSFSGVFNTATIPDGPHNFSAQAVNNAGASGPASTAVQAFIENVALSVSITSPANNAPFKGQVTVTAVPSQPVQNITFTLGSQTVTATSSPYQGNLSLTGVPDGPQTITVTATDFAGDVASSTVTIVVMQTPPAPPNSNLIFAEPPANGISLVHGSAGAVATGGLVINVVDTVSHTTASVTSASDGSFATNIVGAINDTLSLTATDQVGNVSTPTLITIRQTNSLPPSAGSTSLVYQGNLVDRVGSGTNGLSPDGQLDAVFTLSLNVGQGVTRTISSITLVGPQTRSTQSGTGSGSLGVAADVGSTLLNGVDGSVNFPVTTGATLTLFAADNGFIQPGQDYTVTAVFTDGSQFVATFTIVAPADRQYIAHSATITANPAAVIVAGTTPGTTTITLTNIRDIDGNQVPDGAWVALTAADMASLDPRGSPIRSAGGSIVNGITATNNPAFKVYPITNGSVTATYSSGAVSPALITGALAVIQMQAADTSGNVLGTTAIGTADINIRSSSDQAIVMPSPAALYADGIDHRSNFTILLTDVSGNLVPDGTQVIVDASNCAGTFSNGNCVFSAGGTISGGTPNGSGQQLFTSVGGTVSGQYSNANVTVGTGSVNPNSPAVIQVFAANSNGFEASRTVIGTGTVTMTGAGASELEVSPESVPYVFPTAPLVQVLIHHVHDMRANLVPDGSQFILSASNCFALFSNGNCVFSAGGTIGGSAAINGSGLPVFTLSNNQAAATYSIQSATAPAAGQIEVANLVLVPANNTGNELSRTEINVKALNVLGVNNAVGSAQPPTVLADGGIHTSTVTFGPILDTFGNPVPDGSLVVASAANCAALTSNGNCIFSDGNTQIVNGDPSPSGSSYQVFMVHNGTVSVTFADQNTNSAPGQTQTGRVTLMEANSSGAVQSRTALGVVPIGLVGLTSAQATAIPTAIHADGGDFRSTITVSGFRDAVGNPVPDGTMVGLTAANCATLTTNGSCVLSDGGSIIGGTTSPTNSNFQLFPITNGQVVAQYSSQGIHVSSGNLTAVISAAVATPQGTVFSRTTLGTVSVRLLAPSTATVAVNPVDIFSDGAAHFTQVTISGLLDSDGVTPVPDGSKVGVTAVNCASFTQAGSCVLSAGGQISSAGGSPGDGTVVSGNSNFVAFTVAGGKVVAGYSDVGVSTGLGQTQTANVAVVPLDNTGTIVLSRTALGFGTINLHGTSSATASGPATLSISAAGNGTVTFSGIKDSAGNTVPDGTIVLATTGNCFTFTPEGSCNLSTGGTIVDGTTSTWSSSYQQFTVMNGSVTMTYSTAGATTGTATVQLIPATSSGVGLGRTVLTGGSWAINITN